MTVDSSPEAALDVLFRWGAASVLTHLTSQTKQCPLCQGVNVNPLPSEQLRTGGSSFLRLACPALYVHVLVQHAALSAAPPSARTAIRAPMQLSFSQGTALNFYTGSAPATEGRRQQGNL
ncbi:hypothetical protein EVAR_96717_1 [Eumeta japonica]|uniref:Uncharacterized protein n=1 Tax=Eumeta variegata TaxID=151549 RepID=A0A4C1WHY3_EUMVA|nr:hypothetical protein EVAR_96717_1 [Eumeta japonica]